MKQPPAGREKVLVDYAVSRETAEKLDEFTRDLLRWQSIKNLIAVGDIDQVWSRHIADSLQLPPLASCGPWLDLGSGAGFPGLIVAIARPDIPVCLVESNGRKCAFLRHVSRKFAPRARVEAARLEEFLSCCPDRWATVSARALAPLSTLFAWTERLLTAGAIGLFPKGRSYEAELTEASKSWRFEADLISSRTDSNARIVRVHRFEGRIS